MTETRSELRARRNGRRRRSRVILWIVLALVVMFAFVAAWVGVRGMLAKNALDDAVPAATALAGHIVAGDTAAAKANLAILSNRATDAASLTSDPVWRATENLPFLGANLAAVREAAGVLDDVSRNAIDPIVDLTATVGIDQFAPVDGAIPLQPLIDAQPTLSAASDALHAADERVQSIRTDQLFEVVAKAVGTLQRTVSQATEVIDTVDRAARLLPPMMGAEGERNYVLLFQNPAELRASGGIAGALAQLTVTKGAISLTQQASSSDFPKAAAPVLELPSETRDLYGDITGQYIQDVNLTPQFPLSAALAAEMWRQQFGTQVDGVMSVDPIVLSYLLRATGPITLPTGDVLTSENAVQLLLTDVYARYPDPRLQDAFFAAAAAAVFDAVANGGFQPAALLDALARAGDEHRLLVWSAHENEQVLLAETTIAGSLPVSDMDASRIGVYFNDTTGAKMGTYLQTQISAGQAVCRNDGRAQTDVKVTLTNTAPADAATSLPAYVTGGGNFGVPPGSVKTIANIYGVPGSANLGVTRDGMESGYLATSDAGYPVSSVGIELAPGESATFTASFLAENTSRAPIVIQKTPEVNIIPVQKLEISC